MLDESRRLGPSYRQGDILLVACNELPLDVKEELPEDGRVVLARGELTGHAHVMDASRVRYFREDGTGHGFVRVDGEADLQHEEHERLRIAPGVYRVLRQREYRPRQRPGMMVD